MDSFICAFCWHTLESAEPVTVTLSLAGPLWRLQSLWVARSWRKALFCLRLPLLSMETWSLRSLSSVCGDFKKKKKKREKKKKASSISANINLIQTKIKDKAITFNQKHMWGKKGWVDSNEKRSGAECRERWRELYLCLSRCLRVWFAVF